MSEIKREIPCKYYICKSNCKLGRKDVTHIKQCQICNKYIPRSSKPIKSKNGKHLKAKKLAIIRAKEKLDEYYYE